MSSTSSVVTYTSVYTDSEPGRVFWGADEELSDEGSPRVIVYRYDGLPMQPVAPPSPDYVPGPEHPPSPVEVLYVPEPEYPEYLVPSDDEAPMEDQPLSADASPVALSPSYVADSDPEEDSKEDHADYPTDGGDDDDEPFDDDDDDDDTGDENDEPFEDEEEEEHLALADSPAAPVVDHVPLGEDTEAFETDEVAPTHVPSPRRHTARMSVRPQTPVPLPSEAEVERLLALPIPPPSLLTPLSSPLPQIPSPPLPPPPSSLHLPHIVPRSFIHTVITTNTKYQASKFIPPVNHLGEDTFRRAKVTTVRRLCLMLSHRDAGVRRDESEKVGLRHYGCLGLDQQRTVEEEALVSREAWAHSIGLSTAVHYELQAYRTHTQMQDYRIASQESLTTTLIAHNNMPPKRTSAAVRAIAAPMTAAAIEQLIKARVSGTVTRGSTRTPRECTYKDFLNCQPLTFKGTEGVVVLAQWFERMESVFHISNCAVENQVKFATCTFLGNALTWWNSHMKAVTQDVAYAMDWKTLKKMMTDKYCPRGEIKKLEVELWNLKVKGTDVASYTLRFQELALMCGRMFHEESEEVEKYVGGLPDMIRGNVMSYQPKTMEKAIEFANDQMDQKVLTISERQAEQKRKMEFNAGNNQGYQQQNKRQNTRRAYTAGPGEKREYTGSLPLCTKCNYHHKGPCAPRCNKCKKIGHLARDCRSSGPNGNNNNCGNSETTQNAGTCYECGVQGHFRKDCPKLKNGNLGNQRGNDNAPTEVYVVGNAGTNPNSNVVTGTFLLNNRYASILFDTGADRSFENN
ncbi:reverse transcriptase domain-containing protein [Tanacetum coccineum]